MKITSSDSSRLGFSFFSPLIRTVERLSKPLLLYAKGGILSLVKKRINNHLGFVS
jgi:hypothetical protein